MASESKSSQETGSSTSSWENQVLPSLRSPTCYSSLTKSYDALLDMLWKEQEEKDPERVSKNQDAGTSSRRGQLADYLRALGLCCELLMGILEHPVTLLTKDESSANNREKPAFIGPSLGPHHPSSQSANNHPHSQKQTTLKQTIQRSQLLLKVLSEQNGNGGLADSKHETLRQYAASQEESSTGQMIRVVPLKGQHAGLYTYSFGSDDDDSEEDDDNDGNLLMIDRKVLEAEERELILMASTPTPGELRNNTMARQQLPIIYNHQPAKNASLQARIEEEWTKQVYQEACQESKQKRQRVA